MAVSRPRNSNPGNSNPSHTTTSYLTLALIAILALGLAACANTPKKRPAYTGKGAVGKSLWMGQQISAVIEVRGQPSYKLNVPSGDAFVYEPVEDLAMDVQSRDDCLDTYLVNYRRRVVGYYCR